MLRMATTLTYFTLAMLVAWTLIAIMNIIPFSESSCLPLPHFIPSACVGVIVDWCLEILVLFSLTATVWSDIYLLTPVSV